MVAGTGVSGIAAANLLLAQGGEVVLYDSNADLNTKEIRSKFNKNARIRVVVGELKMSDLVGVTLCIISPGIPLDAPFVRKIESVNIPIWSEIELAYHCSSGKLIAITGTNGKTTTTALVGEIMKKHFNDVYVVGNIGDPYTAHADETSDESVTVAEVSSFQLETIMDFHPFISAITNITPDHLDRHKTMENYISIKEGIAKNQSGDDWCVLNYDDEVLREFGETLKCRVLWFSLKEKPDAGVYMDGDMIVYAHDGKTADIVNVKDLQIIGAHNYANVMCAVCISEAMQIPDEEIREACTEFKAVEHRIEFVRERFGVKYYNDSKGTNPDAAIQAIKAMPGPTLLIAGGYDKHSEYDEWIESFDGKVRYLVLIGQTRDKIAECAKKHGINDIMYAEDMEEAVKVCASYANPGDCVLLSPACASWGMFPNYEVRGNIFKDCVNRL